MPPTKSLFEATVKLPERAPEGVATLLKFYVWRFPRIGRETWLRRFSQGKVRCERGPLRAGDPYEPLLETYYQREVEREWPVRTDYRVVHEDADLLVVDKPPFLPVTPGGHYLRNCLLNLLIEQRGERGLAPLHRLDKDTSGLVLFSRCAESRSHFSDLFRRPEGRLAKEYLAVCHLTKDPPVGVTRWEHHIARDVGAYHLQAVHEARAPNAVCEIELLDRKAARGLFLIRPLTGRKHQIRVQLAHEGFPIVNDRFYGPHPRHAPDDLTSPLQLNCHRIAIHGFQARAAVSALNAAWESSFALSWPEEDQAAEPHTTMR